MPIKTICAWCTKVMVENDSTPEGEETHGMCDDCKVKVRIENEQFLKSIANKAQSL